MPSSSPERSVDLEPRHVPTQARAVASFEAILAAAAELLPEVGLGGINTNLIADRAGVQVRTLYRYFPGKHAVLAELYRRYSQQGWALIAPAIEGLADSGQDWRVVIRRLFRRYLQTMLDKPAWIAIRRSVRATPELAELWEEVLAQPGPSLTQAFARRGVRLSPARRNVVAELVPRVVASAVELAIDSPPRRRPAVQREIEELVVRYLAPYLDDEP